MMALDNEEILIQIALEEDFGKRDRSGIETGKTASSCAGYDVTSEAVFDAEKGSYYLLSKDSGILCGINTFARVFHTVDDTIIINKHFSDGDRINSGDRIASLDGKVVSILKGERTALNFISLLSAISTKSARFMQEASGKVVILDTRKTIPGFRSLSKYAVKCGGASNHRTGLYDMAMIKDTHIDAAGGIKAAAEKVKSRWGDKVKIEIEARTFDEVKEALEAGADRIMLDNMDNGETADAVNYINGRTETEASGNMTYKRIKEVSETGVDYISFGELTHTVKAFDFSLKKA
jgi:nicotinate-nucleotide pyrophosphorylase (carboxylating)